MRNEMLIMVDKVCRTNLMGRTDGGRWCHHSLGTEAWLIGQTVAFYNPWHQRFAQMAAYDWGPLTISGQVGSGELCNGCTKETWLLAAS